MISHTKGFTEVHDYDICLSTYIQRIKEVMGKMDQLCFTAQSTSEAMLVLEKQLVFI